jgi:hypothetical protein
VRDWPDVQGLFDRAGMHAVAIYIGRVIVDPGVVAKLNTKHQVTHDEVREALEWPAKVRVAIEDHPQHGRRWVVVGQTGSSRELIAALLPTPEWEGDRADTWVLKTGRWI